MRFTVSKSLLAVFLITIGLISSASVSAAGLSIQFDSSAHPISIKKTGGPELLDGTNSDGFYLRESDATIRRFNTVTDLGGGEYQLGISGSSEQISVRFEGVNDYLTARFTSLSGFALAGERLYFDLDTVGDGLRVLELDYMMSASNSTTSVSIQRTALWESTILGAFALYQYVDDNQEDETLLDLWTMEGLPHPKVDGVWDRAAAEAWLDNWIVESTDSSFFNIEPSDLAEHFEFIPYAKTMDATALYLWNKIWRGEYLLDYRQNDEINPVIYPRGLDDMLDIKNDAATLGLGLMFHYLSGNIGNRDPEFVFPTVHPDLQNWGTMTLNAPIDASATSFVVVPDAGVEMPVIGTDQPIYAPPVISSVFDFKVFRIDNEWVKATSVTDLGNGTWQVDGVSRGLWSTTAASHSASDSLRGYLMAYSDLVPDPNSALLETIATRWANLNNTLELRHASFDGIEFHKAYGSWGSQKFGALVYQNLDHPTSSDSSAGPAPKAWIEYKFNRVQAALGADFRPFGAAHMFLGDESRATSGLEEAEYSLNRLMVKNVRGFSVGGIDGVQGVDLATLQTHGLVSEHLTKVKNWKNASHAMDSAQRSSMEEFVTTPYERRTLNGSFSYGAALWRLKGSVFERWFALGTDIYADYWHYGQEQGPITPRFYLQNGDVQTLGVPSELNSGADRVRIVGRVLPNYDSAAAGNIDLMTYLGGSPLTVSATNSTASTVWTDTGFSSYSTPNLNLSAHRGIGMWVTGDGSGANLVVRLKQQEARDYVVPLNFTDRRWIEIPFGEAAWRARDWGWTKSTRKLMDYGIIKSIMIGIGHLPASTSSSVLVEDLTALSESQDALVNPTITLGEQTVSVTGSIDCGNHFLLDENGLFSVYDPNWNVVFDQQLDVMLPSDLSSFAMESLSSPSGTWLEVGVQASNSTLANPDPTPSFLSDPLIKANATEELPYSAHIGADATDPSNAAMIFTKLDGPFWLSVAPDGTLSGTPLPSDVGLNTFTVEVTTVNGSDSATLNITVDNNGVNDAPVWSSNPVIETPITEGMTYSGSIADDALDFDTGASLSFAKLSGPSWLGIATDGTLSGTPGSSDVGVNNWTVSVSDGIAAPVNATLSITVGQSYEAEDAVLFDTTTSTYTSGYTGSGYTVMTNTGSSYIEWTVNLATTPSAPGKIAFHHLTDANNVFTLTVNGQVTNSSFVLLDTDGEWAMSGVDSVPLTAGDNTIRLLRTSGGNNARVDHMYLDVSNAPPAFTINPINAPDATEDVAYSGSSVANATDPEGDPVTYSKANGPAWLSVAADGSLSGTPGQADTGANVFTVQVYDGIGGVGTATLNIYVTPVNDVPFFASDPISADNAIQDLAYTGNLQASDDDGDTLTYSKVVGPDWLSVATSGALSGTPTSDNLGLNVFTVQVDDGNGGTDIATLNITVINLSGFIIYEAEDAQRNSTRTRSSGGSGFSGSSYVIMKNTSSYIEWTVYRGTDFAVPVDFTFRHWTDGANSMTITVNGQVLDSNYILPASGGTWELSNLATASLNPGSNTIRLKRDGGPNTVRIDYLYLNEGNAAPSFASDPINQINATEDVAYTGSVANATDPEGDAITYSKLSGPAWLSVAADGSLSGTPVQSDVGANVFTVRVSDSTGSDSAALNITVDGVNDAPVFSVDPINLANAVETVAYSGTIANATDEEGDPLTYSKLDGPAWLSVATDGALSGTPLETDVGANVFTVQVSDGVETDTATLNITVEDGNDPPAFTVDPINLANAAETVAYSGTIANATDEDGDPLTYSKVSGPAWLVVGTDGTLSGTPLGSDAGLNVFTVQVADGISGSDTATLNITVDAVNEIPAFTVDPIDAAKAVTLIPYYGTAAYASDSDGDPLTYTILSGPAWLSVTASGSLLGTPGITDLGANVFTVQASDGNGGTATATLNITVIDDSGFVIHEAEDAVLGTSTTSIYSSGYTGSAYVVMSTAGSSYVEWTENLAEAATADLLFSHYTDGDSSMTLSVNGQVVDSNYPLNRTYGEWRSSPVASVMLNAGVNTIRLTRASGTAALRLDHLYLSVDDVFDVLATYDFATGPEATATGSYLTAGSFAAGPGVDAAVGGHSSPGQNMFVRASTTGGTLSDAVLGDDYLSFTLDPNAGFVMSLGSIELKYGYTRIGSLDGRTLTANLLTSIDGFTSADSVDVQAVAVGPDTSTPVYITWTIDLSAAQFQNLSTATEFRFYLSDDDG